MASTIQVSYSELDTSRQCAFKHDLAYKQRWQSPTTSPALSRGTAWHRVMEAHYTALKNFGLDVSIDLLNDVVEQAIGQAAEEEQDLLRWMYAGHLEMWGLDPGWKILAVEHRFETWLPTPAGGRSRFKLKGAIDLIVREVDTGLIYLVDHKSGKDLPTAKMLDLDDQFGLYVWALQALGKKVFGAIHSAARTQRNKDQARHPQPVEERFRRTLLARTPGELDSIALDAYREARQAYSWAPGEAPRSPNTDTCRWRCDYTEPCLMARKGAPLERTLHDFGFRRDARRH